LHNNVFSFIDLYHLTLWRPVAFGDFRKKTLKHMWLRGNFSGLVCSTDLIKVSKDAASLLVCTWKNIFCLGGSFFLWVTS